MALSERDQAVVQKLKEFGVVKYAVTTVEEANRVGLPLSMALATLEKESSGRDVDGRPRIGLNLFGSDPVPNIRGGFVTEERYQTYVRQRKAGKGMQGVGPCQLTWYGLQDTADKMGGCWKPRYNMRVGFAQVKALIKTYGKRPGITRYNGAGPAAQRYADDWIEKQVAWHRWLREHSTG
jgi:hypothetical protein